MRKEESSGAGAASGTKKKGKREKGKGAKEKGDCLEDEGKDGVSDQGQRRRLVLLSVVRVALVVAGRATAAGVVAA